MAEKPTYGDLETRVQELEETIAELRASQEHPQGNARSPAASFCQYEEIFTAFLTLTADPVTINRVSDGRYVLVNDAFSRLTGYSAEEAIGRTPFDLNLYADLADRDRIVACLGKNDRVDGLEVRFRVKDGSVRDDLLSAMPIRYQGEACLISVCKGISALNQVQKTLKESEERYRSILETMEEGYWETDLAGNFTFFNDAMCKIHGSSRDEMMGMNYMQYSSPQDSERIYSIYNQIYRTGIPAKFIDFEVIRKDGSVVMAESSASLIKNSSGKPVGFRGISRDRTEQRKAERALRESEEKHRLVVENANEGIFIIQGEAVKFPNSRTKELTGCSTEELASMSFLDLVHSEDKAVFRKAYHEKSEAEERCLHTQSFRIVNKKGEILWVELNHLPISWEERPATLNFLKDLTPQKKMEAQLLQAKKLEAIGTLAGGIAHDFNNLLMGIQGNTSLILLDMDSENSHYGNLRSIEKLVKNGSELTRQLLGAARRGKYEVTPTNLNELIRASADLFGRTKKEISIHVRFQEDLWTVEVDQGQIEQVLLNLYVNAWHAMPEGGELFIETQNLTLTEYDVRPYDIAPGRFVRISVTDTGIGMDEAVLKRVFDPFFTTRQMGRGTGLGLASAYGIVRNHNGVINVYSEKGEGSTFNVYLPATDKEIHVTQEKPDSILNGSETILFVDDEDAIVELGHRFLSRLGFHVKTAKSGQEALEVYRKEKAGIDLVILDMIMPKMSGGETYDRLKQMDPSINVLLSSGYSLNGQAQEILDRGCRGFIQKPYTLEKLSRKVREVLDH